MTIETGLIFVISIILLWIKPGPGQAAVIAQSLKDGFLAGFCIAAGIMVGNSFYFLIAAIGLTLIINHIEEIGLIMKFFGAFYLFYLGYKGLSNAKKGVIKEPVNTKSSKEIFKNFSTGFLITLSNPFVIFFYIALLPGLVPLAELMVHDIVIAVALILYFGLSVYAILIMLVTQVRQILAERNTVEKINITASIGFIVIGAFLLFSALTNYSGAFNI